MYRFLLRTLIWISIPGFIALTADNKPYEYTPADFQKYHPRRDESVEILPDKFLREYDPVTFFYKYTRHIQGAGPEDNPENYVTMTPSHPGEYRWIDKKTLEFRPTIPWPPLTTFKIKAGSVKHRLSTVLNPPEKIEPSNGSKGHEDVKRVKLVFDRKIDRELLKKLVTFEYSALPAVNTSNTETVDQEAYRIKAGEQKKNGSVPYSFIFNKAFPLNSMVRIEVKLSDAKGLSNGKRVYKFETKRNFKLVKAGTYRHLMNIARNGSSYPANQAIEIGKKGRIVAEFSTQLSNISMSEAKRFFRFSPSPKEFSYRVSGNRIIADISINPERLYQVELHPISISDRSGNPLEMTKSSTFYFYRNPKKSHVRWEKSYSILERYGAQHVPLDISSVESFDLRIYKIDPENKAFFPFPDRVVTIDESKRPAGPGEEPRKESRIFHSLSTKEIADHIEMLGSPHYSSIINTLEEGVLDHQAIDLKPKLAKISRKNKPGTYLVGFRTLKGSKVRHYIKVQVTDLCLTTVESKNEILFNVTSYRTGKPVQNASVLVQGLKPVKKDGKKKTEYVTFYKGRTNHKGQCSVKALNSCDNCKTDVKRVVVKSGNDNLVLDSRRSHAPPFFANNHWTSNRKNWLDWLPEEGYDFDKDRSIKAFLFTERPIYKPGEKVYFKGYIRNYLHGRLSHVKADSYKLIINGPSDEWRVPLEIKSNGSISYEFDKEVKTTGLYRAKLKYSPVGKDRRFRNIANTSFKVDDYRIPKFEVHLHSKDMVRNDKPFRVNLTSSYYAGGSVIEAPVDWRINTYPYTWSINGWDDYILSSDMRYNTSRNNRGKSSDRSTTTDEDGSSEVTIKPQASPSANPVKYVVEGTVTDVDNQTVTDARSIVALPPFVLGLKTERFIKEGSAISADLAVIGIDEKPLKGQKVTVELKKNAWHSYLQETDFAKGDPEYKTEKHTELIEKRTVTTKGKPSKLTYKNLDPGVYVFDITTKDELGRVQRLKADVFLSGDDAVTWKKPEQHVFETSSDKEAYVPGETAEIILKSPYQNGLALAVQENPDGYPEYSWVEVENGQGVYSFKITKDMVPRIPVSFVLIRPRISRARVISEGAVVDPGKPQTVANTTWLKVKPTANQLDISLDHEDVYTPGSEMDLVVSLKDWKGRAVSGEVALWLVDRAVLSLEKEKSINPIPNFTNKVESHIRIRDSRNLANGRLFVPENPGGGDGVSSSMEGALKITVRKNFETVPYYNPSLKIGRNGKRRVKIDLPDNLSQFAVRAVAASGVSKFGHKKSAIAVRLPVIVQPDLPRFVRIGDTLTAGGIARVVEGKGGEGLYSFEQEGMEVLSSLKPGKWESFEFPGKKGKELDIEMAVESPGYNEQGLPAKDSVSFKMSVRKQDTEKGDAFRVSLPLLPDRRPVTNQILSGVSSDSVFVYETIKERVRKNTLHRELLLCSRDYILKMLGGLRYLIEYPYGGSEQRVSRAHTSLMYKDIWQEIGVKPMDPEIDKYVNETLEMLEDMQDDNGLFAYWPGGDTHVYLTAYITEFMLAVKEVDKGDGLYDLSEDMLNHALAALKRSLRSDYSRYLDGYKYYERCAALLALAKAGEADLSYMRELAAYSQETDALSQSRIYKAMLESKHSMKETINDLEEKLWNRTVFRLREGRERFTGLQSGSSSIGAKVHGSEINVLAGLVSALSERSSDPDKVDQMFNYLVALGDAEGWGNTHTNALTLRALREGILHGKKEKGRVKLDLISSGDIEEIDFDKSSGVLRHQISNRAGGSLGLSERADDEEKIYAKLFERYLPSELGSDAEAVQKGFVVKRQHIFVSGDEGVSKRMWLDSAGQVTSVSTGTVLEEHVQVTNQRRRNFVAVSIPLAAGFEYLNPELETAHREAEPSGRTTNRDSYHAYLNDRIVFYFDRMHSGTYDFYFRVRATTPGSFSQPPARADMMYESGVYGNSNGARVRVND